MLHATVSYITARTATSLFLKERAEETMRNDEEEYARIELGVAITILKGVAQALITPKKLQPSCAKVSLGTRMKI